MFYEIIAVCSENTVCGLNTALLIVEAGDTKFLPLGVTAL
jgi:hypothetical protein